MRGARSWLALAAVVLPVLLLGGAGALVVAAAGQEAGSDADAVVALAGDGERLRVAGRMAAQLDGELVVSWIPGTDADRDALCGDEPSPARCFVPRPASTAGEAASLRELSDERGWERIVVVTSRYHVGRSALLLRQCFDGGDVRVVSAGDALPPLAVVEEALGVLAGLTVQRAC